MSARLNFIHKWVPATRPNNNLTLLLLHGTGGNEDDLIPLGSELSPGSSMLSPRGNVLENGMPRFFRRFAEGVFDVEDLKYRTNELAGFIEAASSRYGLNQNSIVGVGYSNGANIGASLLLLHPGVLRGAVLFRPMVPVVPEKQPDLAGNPVYISAGMTDPIVARRETERLVKMFREYRADVTLNWVNTGHSLAEREVQDAKVWFDQTFA
ncbi:MAG TPA: alpha/beta hydrolase [Candidatus Acidoferrum sp.]|nr:alpha/beta hydrolase [Candidatus Acidoferrum sp.]